MALTEIESPKYIELAGNPIWVNFQTNKQAEDFIGIHYTIKAYLDAVYVTQGSEMRFEPDSNNQVVRDIHDILKWDPEKEFTWPETINQIINERNDLRRLYKIDVSEKYGNPLVEDDSDSLTNLLVLPGKISDLKRGLLNAANSDWWTEQQASEEFLTNSPRIKKTDAWASERLYYINSKITTTTRKLKIEINYSDNTSTTIIKEVKTGVSGADVLEIITSFSTLGLYIIDTSKTVISYKVYLVDETILSFADWFLPSLDSLALMDSNLHQYGVGNFATSIYWSSSERTLDTAHNFSFSQGIPSWTNKNVQLAVRACRKFTAPAGTYSLRDVGPAGGLIFNIVNDIEYYEAAPNDQTPTPTSQVWSNVFSGLIGTTGTAVGTGQANTTAIIAQVGHTDSAAKLCDDYEIQFPDLTAVSEEFIYEMDNIKKPDARYFIFANAHKMPEGIRFIGHSETNTDYEFQEAKRNLPKDYSVDSPSNIKSNSLETEIINTSSGWLTKDEMNWYREFALSNEVYEIINGEIIPIIVISKKEVPNRDDSNLRAFNIQYIYGHTDSVPGIIPDVEDGIDDFIQDEIDLGGMTNDAILGFDSWSYNNSTGAFTCTNSEAENQYAHSTNDLNLSDLPLIFKFWDIGGNLAFSDLYANLARTSDIEIIDSDVFQLTYNPDNGFGLLITTQSAFKLIIKNIENPDNQNTGNFKLYFASKRYLEYLYENNLP